MTTLPPNTQMTFADERTQLPILRCFRLAGSLLGPAGVILAVPVLLAVFPAVALAADWVRVGKTLSGVIYCGSIFATTVVCVAVFSRVGVSLSGTNQAGLVSTPKLIRSALVLLLTIMGSAMFPLLVAGFRHRLPPVVCDVAHVVGCGAVGVWCLLWPLVVSALATEGCDAMDAISRALHFLLSRPVAVVFRLLVTTLVTAAIIGVGWALTSALGTRIPLIIAVIQATSFLASSWLLTYLYLREQVDAIEWDELPEILGPPEDIPLSGRAAARRRHLVES